MKKMSAVAGVLALMAGLVLAQESKYDTSSTAEDPSVLFGPGQGKTVVTAVSASSDTANGAIKFYAKNTRYTPTATPTNGATVIYITNTGIAFTNSNIAVYAHADGTLDQTTISSATSTSVTLTAGITVAGATGDYLYKLTQQGQMVVGDSLTYAGTNATLNVAGYTVFATPADSPLYVTVDSMTNTCLQVTVNK